MARLRTPSSARACEPRASLCSGTPNNITPASPAATASVAAFRSDSGLCWTTPGIELIGRGSPSPSATKSGSTNCRASTVASATMARMAAVDRNLRGRCRIIGGGSGCGAGRA